MEPDSRPPRSRERPTLDDLVPTADGCAQIIRARWQAVAENIIATGRELIRAKDRLPQGEFGRMVEEQLPFGLRTAQMLMEIAKHPVLANTKHVSHLPSSWGTLYALSRLPDEVLNGRLHDGTIHPEIRRHDVRQLMPAPKARHDAVIETTAETDTDLATFDRGVMMLFAVCRNPFSRFQRTERTTTQIRSVADFLRRAADAIDAG